MTKIEWTTKTWNPIVPKRLEIPLRTRKATTWFVDSMSDLFHELVTDDQIFQILGIASICRHHTFQILTKRPERLPVLSSENAQRRIFKWGCHWADEFPQYKSVQWQWPLPNVWLGVSVENQRTADERIPLLLQTPAVPRYCRTCHLSLSLQPPPPNHLPQLFHLNAHGKMLWALRIQGRAPNLRCGASGRSLCPADSGSAR